MSPRQTVNNPSKHQRSLGGTSSQGFADPRTKLRGVKVAGDSGLGLIRRLATERGGGGHGSAADAMKADYEYHLKKTHACAYTGCRARIRHQFVACFAHWELVPPALKDALRQTRVGDPARAQVWKQAVRFLEIRSRLSELIGS